MTGPTSEDAERPNEQALRIALRQLIQQHGRGTLADTRRVRAMLSDALPDATAQISLIALALSAGTYQRLAATPPDPESVDAEIDRIDRELRTTSALQPEASRWAVSACAWAMGLPTQQWAPSPVVEPSGHPATAPMQAPSRPERYAPPESAAATKAREAGSRPGFAPPAAAQPAASPGPVAADGLVVALPDRELHFAPGASVGIGRDPANAVTISAQAVSRRHAELAWRDGDWHFRDLGSTQGTFRDGVAVHEFTVHGAVDLTLGQGADAVVMRLRGPGQPEPAVPLRPGGALVEAPAAATELGQGAQPALTVTAGDQTRTVLAGQELRIGREADNGLVLSEPTISRHHATIARDGTSWVLSDHGSSAGTWLDNELVRRIELAGRQSVVLGDPATGATLLIDAPGTAKPARRPRPLDRRLSTLLSGERRNVLLAGAAIAVVAIVLVAFFAFGSTGSGGTTSENDLARATVKLEVPGASGSGVIIDRGRGLILTNAHVVAPAAVGQAVATWRFSDEAETNPSKVQVDVSPGVDRAAEPRFIAKVVAVDGYLDIAVIKISQTMSGAEIDPSDLSGLTQVSLGNSDTAHSGDAITAIGYPGAADSTAPTLTRGVISGIIGDPRLHTNRAKLNLDATISPGNSGGSASDSHGRLIGVTTWGLRDDKGQTVLSSMRPINLTKPVITAAQQGKTYTSPWTKPGPEGAEVSDLTFATAGDGGTIETGCRDSSTSSGPVAISFAYQGFPGGAHTDVLAALYDADVTNPGPDDQLAIATTTLDSSYPAQLPESGCATMTFAPLSGRLSSGKYLLKIGVGGDLRVVKTALVTL